MNENYDQHESESVDISATLNSLMPHEPEKLLKSDSSVTKKNKTHELFVEKTKIEIAAMSPVDRKKYQIARARYDLTQLRISLKAVEGKSRKNERKLDTKKMILLGRLFTKLVSHRSYGLSEILLIAELDDFLVADGDRTLFDLRPLNKKSA